MKLKDVLRLAAQGLWRRRARTVLTIVGVIIGTACIVLMMALGITNYAQFKESVLNNASLTRITVYGGGASAAAKLSGSVIEQIAAIPGVSSVSPVIRIPGSLISGRYVMNCEFSGVNLNAMGFEYDSGGGFTPGNVSPQVVLGHNAVKQFIDPEHPPDYENYDEYEPDIDLYGGNMDMMLGYKNMGEDAPTPKIYRASVCGVLKNSQDEDSYGAFIDIGIAKKLIMENRKLASYFNIDANSYNQAIIRTDAMEDVEGVLEEVKKLGFETYSPVEWINQMQEENARQQGQLSAIGLISLAVSAIGIANTMYTSVLERRNEIGVMKVVGMKLSKIRLLYLSEAAMIGVIGGALGVILSYAVALVASSGQVTNFLGIYLGEGVRLGVPLWLAAGAVLFSACIGMAAGIYPAWSATRLSPMEAIRGAK